MFQTLRLLSGFIIVFESYCNSSFIYKDGRRKARIARWAEILESILKPKVNNFKTLEENESTDY